MGCKESNQTNLLKLNVSYQGLNLQNACLNSNQGRPNQNASTEVFAVFLFIFFVRQIVFKILEHLPYLNVLLYICMYIIKPKMSVLCCTCLCLSLMLLSTSLYPYSQGFLGNI